MSTKGWEGLSRAHMHGFQNQRQSWEPPKCTLFSETPCRPGYTDIPSHEFHDHPDVLREKVATLALMVKKAQHLVTYTGAGLSTSAGVNDYASDKSSKVQKLASAVKLPVGDKPPALGHRVLAHMYHAGYIKRYVQQNHDGFPQKAGYPQHAMNEIHGGWFDPSNPVVPMKGSLRTDLFEDLVKWAKCCDLVLAIGTSLSGMNADQLVELSSTRARRHMPGQLGAVIISLQRTRLDHKASLRIFADIDQVMMMLAEELGLDVAQIQKEQDEKYIMDLNLPPEVQSSANVFQLPFCNKTGKRLTEGVSTFNLNIGSVVKITSGRKKGELYRVAAVRRAGWSLQPLDPNEKYYRHLGKWWLQEGHNGHFDELPICMAS